MIRLATIALLGRADTPTDAVEEYCWYLSEALRAQGIRLTIERVPLLPGHSLDSQSDSLRAKCFAKVPAIFFHGVRRCISSSQKRNGGQPDHLRLLNSRLKMIRHLRSQPSSAHFAGWFPCAHGRVSSS